MLKISYDAEKQTKGSDKKVDKSAKEAQKGDIVTLSPACASFDLYPNFEVRGQHFKRLVKELAE